MSFFSSNLFAQDAPKLPSKDKFHLYLLIGQSNMAGRGVVAKNPAPPHARVLKLDKTGKWVPATDPLHFDKPIAGVGLGSSFARTMADADPEVTIGLIPSAVGGTPLSRWVKGGDLYQQAVKRTQPALKVGVLKGILWHQGESDSNNEMNATTYAKRLSGMISDLRADLKSDDAPFVAGKLGLFLPEGKGKPALWKTVNEQLDEVARTTSKVMVVSSEGLKHKGDQVHFDTASLEIFGRRYAEAMQKLQKK
ncbi:MAG: sialate O-acetylesterase [Zavarzinella sp.]